MLGDNIKFLRNQYKVTQRDLAKELNISHSTLGMYEINSREPNNEMLCKIADYFNVTTDMLLDRNQLELHIKSDYLKILRKAESLNIPADELDLILDTYLKLKGKG
jgi:transcriptional regulator with XRE-family HTH domain